jgi:hypothetical protein
VSTTDPNDLRDPRFDSAWRAASNEEPPKALDDAIRAAARREARAGPQSANARAASVPSALRPERWWAPLAAAATIGAIAFGLLQLVHPDKVGTPGADKAVVSDMPEAPAKAKARAESAGDAAQAPAAAESSVRSRVATPPPAPVPAPAATPPPSPALRKDAGLVAPAAAPVPEPFPADAVKREAKQDAVAALPPPASTPAESGATGMAAGKLSSAPEPPVQGAAMRDAQRATAPVSQSFAPKPAAPTRRLQESESTRNAAAAGGATSAELDAAVDARAKTPAKLAVPDWIALIRKLRDEGKSDEAAKELAAFRAAYPDHDRLLPSDLRDWKPAAR